jgi:flagellar biosynthesis/type III secretory pathway chaperone
MARQVNLRELRSFIAVLQKNLSARQNVTTDLQEVIMTLSITYAQLEAETQAELEAATQVGLQEGREEAQSAIALRMLQEGLDRELVSRITEIPID